MARAKKTSKDIKDITELGQEVDGLQEIEVTEVQSLIEDVDTLSELIEEKDEECDQEKEEDKDSKSKLTKQEPSQDQTEKKVEQLLSEDSNESEVKEPDEELSTNSKGSGIKTVKAQTPKTNTSSVQSKSAQKVPTQPKQEAQKPSGKPQGIRSVKPKTSSNDGLIRSTYGLFSR